jgi:hypothetical protein
MDWASEKQKKMVSVRNQVEDCELLSFSHFIQRQRCRYFVGIQFFVAYLLLQSFLINVEGRSEEQVTK